MEVGCRMAAAMLVEEHGGLKTELCLGLPGGGEISEPTTKMTTNLKRGFSETVDLKLKLHHHEESNNIESSTSAGFDVKKENNYLVKSGCVESDKAMVTPKDPTKPPAKAQVVGWPPVRSFRKNMMADHHKSNTSTKDSDKAPPLPVTAAAFVKVSMDGAPYLRKVDLKMYKSYQELSDALAKMFSSFTMGDYGSQGMIDFMNERKLMDVLNSSEYVPTYEDKDGDWMLMGDVPWEMFVDSCKRIRITKGSEAIGLAPRAMEKCKNRW